jgi:DeoR/GlpR family transcriptional regulator of sugar metabolism
MRHVLPVQRRKRLLEIMSLDGGADVGRLASSLNVSAATVRRDLKFLADEGYLRRIHGGAILPSESTAFYPQYEKKIQQNQLEKVSVARAASARVADGDVVVLDSGSTTLMLARELRAKHGLTVITTDLKIALELGDVPNLEVIIVGGTIRARSYNTIGPFAEQMLEELHANHSFLGADAVDLRAGVTNATVPEVPIKRLLIRAGRVVTLLVDHTKFGRVGLAKVADLTEFDEIVTSAGISSTTRSRFTAAGIRLTVVEAEDGT